MDNKLKEANLATKVKTNIRQEIKSKFKYSLDNTFYNASFKDYSYQPNISNFYFHTPSSNNVESSSNNLGQ